MTIDEAHIEVEVTVDKRSTSQAPELPAEVIDYFLNEATARYVKTRYGKNNLYQAGFEEIQKRTEDLRTLVVTEDMAVATVTTEDNTYAVTLDDTANQYWFFLRGRAVVTSDNCGTKTMRVKQIQQDDLNKVLIDPFNKPIYYRPIIYFENGQIYVVTDGDFTIDSFKLTYLKEPQQVDSTSSPQVEWDMPEHTHKEIVQLACDIIIENIESQRINTIKGQLQNVE